MTPILQIGPYALHTVETGLFALDGGAMFGVVPKPMWEKKYPCDEKNRIPLAARALLLLSKDRKILVDVGLGDKWQAKDIEIYKIDQSRNRLMTSLQNLGVAPEEITDVVLTHLHFDHAGGSTRIVEGKCVPTFANATYHVQEKNWNHAQNPTLRDKASYLKPDFAALAEFDQLNLLRTPDGFDHDEEILPGVQGLVCYGHTPALQMIKISDGKQTVLYPADTVPTHAHLPVPWVMGYDLQPLVTCNEKIKLLEKCKTQQWRIFFEHDEKKALVTVAFDERGNPYPAAENPQSPAP